MILLCDEATSALDTRTEKQILQALQTLAHGRTSLFVAHRLSTAAQCDQIVVLEAVSCLSCQLCTSASSLSTMHWPYMCPACSSMFQHLTVLSVLMRFIISFLQEQMTDPAFDLH